MAPLPGRCYCGLVRYVITLPDPESDARTSICHCGNCKKFTGGNYGITTRVPRSAFRYLANDEDDEDEDKGGDKDGDKTAAQGVKVHEADNGSGVVLHREFCGTCGAGILEYGASAGGYVYVFYGTLEDHARGQVEPKGEFFCRLRDPWMPEISGLFQKQEIHE